MEYQIFVFMSKRNRESTHSSNKRARLSKGVYEVLSTDVLYYIIQCITPLTIQSINVQMSGKNSDVFMNKKETLIRMIVNLVDHIHSMKQFTPRKIINDPILYAKNSIPILHGYVLKRDVKKEFVQSITIVVYNIEKTIELIKTIDDDNMFPFINESSQEVKVPVKIHDVETHNTTVLTPDVFDTLLRNGVVTRISVFNQDIPDGNCIKFFNVSGRIKGKYHDLSCGRVCVDNSSVNLSDIYLGQVYHDDEKDAIKNRDVCMATDAMRKLYPCIKYQKSYNMIHEFVPLEKCSYHMPILRMSACVSRYENYEWKHMKCIVDMRINQIIKSLYSQIHKGFTFKTFPFEYARELFFSLLQTATNFPMTCTLHKNNGLKTSCCISEDGIATHVLDMCVDHMDLIDFLRANHDNSLNDTYNQMGNYDDFSASMGNEIMKIQSKKNMADGSIHFLNEYNNDDMLNVIEKPGWIYMLRNTEKKICAFYIHK
jgi:hypothetical protein